MAEVRREVSSNCNIYEDKDAGYKTGYWTGQTSRSSTRLTVKGDRFNSLSIRDNAVCQNARAKFCAKYGETESCRATSTPTKTITTDPLGSIVDVFRPARTVVQEQIEQNKTSPKKTTPLKFPTVLETSRNKNDEALYNRRAEICAKQCGNIFFDAGCYWDKWQLQWAANNLGLRGCDGSTTFNDVFGSGTLDENKEEVCAKTCDPFDLFCKGAKLQVGCGGVDNTFYILGAMALAAFGMILIIK